MIDIRNKLKNKLKLIIKQQQCANLSDLFAQYFIERKN